MSYGSFESESQTPKTNVPTVPATTITVPIRETSMNDESRVASSRCARGRRSSSEKMTCAPSIAKAESRWSERIQSFRLTRGTYSGLRAAFNAEAQVSD